ncbi:dihydroorotate dehydrogenase (NAD+) catalytic subunit [Ruminiclostridium sufflavum DSM 19573]|uniref:Dihydroorotate dehydrogenase n=1 Tax=Ruminiclostridium sufflavum DSM 19573 TaxID=1121337 RepID=A0A318XUH5_9FIRM|nr:dihydroorotate dehydrogenase [Ruminiclostridium sufflavum]PYG90310.1 dihydroorotate dehydrogenase (NAD+) catalytic subunit [Ruminiclostridium sufflavum DSM 19573]
MSNTKVDFAGVAFKNPVVLASGTCGFGREFGGIFDIEKLGGISSKGLTLCARDGNEGIRIWETPSGIMNSVGMENPGVHSFAEQDLEWINSLNLVNIVNVGGHCCEDYLEAVEYLNQFLVDFIELNISCPNVKSGGMNFGIKTEVAREIVREVRKLCKHRLTIKLSPNAEDIVSLAEMCEAEGADGISMVNTFLALAIDIKKKKPVFNNVYAGLSGPAIKPVALRMVNQVAKRVRIPIMGMGGIASWMDAIEFIMAGATVIQVGTASFIKPDMGLAIAEGIRNYMESNKIYDLKEIRGII